MGDLLMEHMLQDMRTELKAMSRQLDNMNRDIQEIKKQLTTIHLIILSEAGNQELDFKEISQEVDHET